MYIAQQSVETLPHGSPQYLVCCSGLRHHPPPSICKKNTLAANNTPKTYRPTDRAGCAPDGNQNLALHPPLRPGHQPRCHREIEGGKRNPGRVSVGRKGFGAAGTGGVARGPTKGVRRGKVSPGRGRRRSVVVAVNTRGHGGRLAPPAMLPFVFFFSQYRVALILVLAPPGSPAPHPPRNGFRPFDCSFLFSSCPRRRTTGSR